MTNSAPLLVLFDIDGTLYHGDGSGRAAFGDTFREILGESFVDHQIDFAGRLDTWIFEELLRLNGVEATVELLSEFKRLSPGHLARRIQSGEFNVRRCAGAFELVRLLDERKEEWNLTLGLLTGNWPINGMLKISSVGFEPVWFVVNAWGDDAGAREDLPAVARKRFGEFHGSSGNGSVIPFERMVIVGDTIHDVGCAFANGCRSLAVATGWCSAEELGEAGADRVVEDLRDTKDLATWILEGDGVVRPKC